jgi:hypothetical protein
MRAARLGYWLAALVIIPWLAASPAWGHFADDQSPATSMYLGKIPVYGQENIMRTLQALKIALQRPFSTNAADADQVVCRINKAMGEDQYYLECATNREYSQQRAATQLQRLVTDPQSQTDPRPGDKGALSPAMVEAGRENALENIIALQPGSRLHIPVNAAKLLELLENVPTPTAAPAMSTAPANSHSPN